MGEPERSRPAVRDHLVGDAVGDGLRRGQCHVAVDVGPDLRGRVAVLAEDLVLQAQTMACTVPNPAIG